MSDTNDQLVKSLPRFTYGYLYHVVDVATCFVVYCSHIKFVPFYCSTNMDDYWL